jgi:hypothetical protein
MTAPNGNVLVRYGSHRMFDKLKQLLGYQPRCWFSYRYPGNLVEVPLSRLEEALRIKGCRKARVNLKDWGECWDA